MTIEGENSEIVALVSSEKEPAAFKTDRRVYGRIEEIHTEALLVLGPLGAGKTSLVKWFVSKHGSLLGKMRLIINDVGSENVDAARLAEDANVMEEDLVALKSGCICCEDLESLRKELADLKGKVDTVVIEPTGIAEGEQISESLKNLGIPAAVVTLVDVLHHDLRKPVEQQVLDTQLAVADAIGLTWWENAQPEEVEAVLEYIGARRQNVPIVKLPKRPFGEQEILGEMRDEEHETLVEAAKLQRDKREFREKAEKEDAFLPWGGARHHGEHKDDHHHHEHGHQEDGHDHHHSEKAPVFSASFTEINPDLTAEDLDGILAQYSDVLIRAKGVIGGRRFNYVHGSLEWEKADFSGGRLNFITSEEIDQDGLKRLLRASSVEERSEIESAYSEEVEQIIRKYLAMNKVDVLKYSQSEIQKLVGMYERWIDLDGQIRDLNAVGKVDARIINGLQMEQKKLGEDMTFGNPLVWLGYKLEAYRGTPKELRTVANLRKHCDSPTYICNKRLTYLNKALGERFGVNLLNDQSVPGETLLQDILDGEQLSDLSSDERFMKGWQKHEYFKQRNGFRMRVAKWENFLRN